MSEALFYLDPDSGLSLQSQIRQKLADGILSGAFPPGTRLPSSRRLADQLGVARNTVVLAIAALFLFQAANMGLASGPVVAAALLGQDDYGRVIWTAVIALLASLLAIVYPALLQRRLAAAPPAAAVDVRTG